MKIMPNLKEVGNSILKSDLGKMGFFASLSFAFIIITRQNESLEKLFPTPDKIKLFGFLTLIIPLINGWGETATQTSDRLVEAAGKPDRYNPLTLRNDGGYPAVREQLYRNLEYALGGPEKLEKKRADVRKKLALIDPYYAQTD